MARANVLGPLRWKRAKIHRGSRRRNIGPHHEAGYTSAVVTEPESVKAVAIGRGPYTSTYEALGVKRIVSERQWQISSICLSGIQGSEPDCMTRLVFERDQPHIRSPFATAAPTSRLRRVGLRKTRTILENESVKAFKRSRYAGPSFSSPRQGIRLSNQKNCSDKPSHLSPSTRFGSYNPFGITAITINELDG